ncbi:major facilitator superfamily transporter [Coniochaeta ligniaria NRRL 30616]|uniref:Major facilitator superfamily transporter n=1 Tax=Coniochaeta ligniaria NRRL 30616 TaxID=1408157 RepID=A0A1J7I6I7_9PEZI|nr:major facilitator superfamily transporter [Coniochaeta ligniaria NRRL 30616]
MEQLEMTAHAALPSPNGQSMQSPEDNQDTEHPPPTIHELAPTDRGAAAWKLLGVAFVFEALLWGFPLSFGVFQSYYSTLPEFAGNRYISVVGTVATGISYLGAPFVLPLIKRYQKYQRQMIWVGWPLCIAGLAAGSFTSTLEGLILTQGVAYGLGFLIFYYPILNMVNEYWVSRRGMAYGILCGSSGVSGAILPLVSQVLLEKYGYKTTLRIITIALVVLTGPLIPFLKGRLPAPEHSQMARADWSFLRNPLFWVYSISNILQGLGYFIPSLYLPSYAASAGSSGKQGALLVTLMSVSQVAGQFLFGYLSDRKIPLNILVVCSTTVAAIASLTLWRLASSLPPLVVFAIVYGFFGSGYTAVWARMSTTVSSNPATAPMIYGLFCFGKGIGNVLAGPITGGLITALDSTDRFDLLRYAGIVVFTGISMLLSTCAIGSWYVKPLSRSMKKMWRIYCL